MTIAFNKFNQFVADLANKVHDLDSDILKLMLTNTAPITTNTVKANITEIAAGNGYSAGGAIVSIASSAQVAGLYKLIAAANVVFTASGGSIATFRYLVLYNSSASGGPLIGYYDYGSALSLNNGDSYTPNFDNTNGILELQ